MIFISQGGETRGPYSKLEIHQRCANGEISRLDAMYWQEGMNNWRPISELLVTSMPPPVPPSVSKAEPPAPHRMHKGFIWLAIGVAFLFALFLFPDEHSFFHRAIIAIMRVLFIHSM